MTELLTERLLLRPWRGADLDPLAELCGDPEVMRLIGDGSTYTRAQSLALLATLRRHWQDFGFGLWAAEQRTDGRLLGWIGLSHPRWFPALAEEVEVGWRLTRDAWGRGLATEGGRAALDYAFNARKLKRVICLVDPDNAASLRVAQKLGLTHERTVTHPTTRGQLKLLATKAP